MIKLGEGETVVTAYAESASGAGWANQPIWVIIRDRNQNLREECLQPEEQTRDLLIVYKVAEEMHKFMSYAATTALLELNERSKS